MKSAFAALVLVSCAVALAFFGMRSGPGKGVTQQVVLKPQPMVVAEVSYPCRIVPRESVWAGTPILGPVEAVYVDVGQMVTDGQVLARVNSGAVAPGLAGMERDASADHVREVTVRLAVASAAAKRLQVDVTRARSAVGQAEPVFRKQEMLNAAGATPRLVFETAKAEYKRASRELSGVEEESRVADNLAARIADELGAAQVTAKEKAGALVAAAAGMAAAEIHAPAAGLVVERKISVGDAVMEGNKSELFLIAVKPELLRAEFQGDVGLRVGQVVAIRAGGVEIRAVLGDGGGADFESRLGAVGVGTECSGTVRFK